MIPPAASTSNGSRGLIHCFQTQHSPPCCKEILLICPKCDRRTRCSHEEAGKLLLAPCRGCEYDSGKIIIHEDLLGSGDF